MRTTNSTGFAVRPGRLGQVAGGLLTLVGLLGTGLLALIYLLLTSGGIWGTEPEPLSTHEVLLFAATLSATAGAVVSGIGLLARRSWAHGAAVLPTAALTFACPLVAPVLIMLVIDFARQRRS